MAINEPCKMCDTKIFNRCLDVYKVAGAPPCAKLVEVAPSASNNNERDAIAAWLNHCKWHLKMNGPACDITNDEKCKHWFIMGYKAATAPVS